MKMHKILSRTFVSAMTLSLSLTSFAGNEDRIGSAGATELLINPWARGAAFGDAGVACGIGLASVYTNIAGLAFTEKTEIMFDRTSWLGGTGTTINAAGLAQRINESTVLSVAVMSVGFGDIDITTENLPEGGIGTYSPKYNNFNIGFAHEFSSSIYGGINVKVISQSIANVKGTGVAFDAGIRYVTGEQDQMKFGITLKNVGPTMSMSGDGLSISILYPESGETATLQQRSAEFEMPSLLSIGGSYDFNFTETNKLTVALAFSANSFSNDQFRLGVDYGMDIDKASFHLIAGYVYERGIFSQEFNYGERLSALSGVTAGLAVDAKVGKNKSDLGIQYTYRSAKPFSGIHSIGLTINLK
jgi:hypothetical protein